MNSLYNKILNIKQENTEEMIKDAINETKSILKSLPKEQMCLVYNSYLYNSCQKRHLLVHTIDTNDLNITYQHRFLIIYDGINYYLCDLTYSQFKSNYFIDLLTNGYMKLNNKDLQKYLQIISQENLEISIDAVFMGDNNSRR